LEFFSFEIWQIWAIFSMKIPVCRLKSSFSPWNMEKFRQNKKNTDWRVLYSFFFPLPKNCQKGNYFKTLAKIPCFFHKRVAKFHPNWGSGHSSGHSSVYFYDLSTGLLVHVRKCLHLSQNWGYLALWLRYKIEKTNLW
jgi:hypothetical protein